ncbi:MAG: UvrB/UvrC motif-containing protein [Deltaproteobacteria bacterium]|nr:UvrB/UvrC motif-containing protein [Deltaproteobacteria bacterium]
MGSTYEADYVTVPAVAEEEGLYLTGEGLGETIMDLTEKMKEAAAKLEFEDAALLRDKIKSLEKKELEILSID